MGSPGKAGILPPVSGALTPRFLERLQNAGLMDLKRMALFQEIPTATEKEIDFLAEAMVTLGFWTPLPGEAADEQPDDVSSTTMPPSGAFACWPSWRSGS